MIDPAKQWCHQIDITNRCHLRCSNCTRLLSHSKKRFWMDLETFRAACKCGAEFLRDSDPCPQGRDKVVGIIGGEPLLHPQFPELVDIMCEEIPEARLRGLWTSLDWKHHRHAEACHRLLGRPRRGYLNWNMHTERESCVHQPIGTAARDLVEDEKERWELIENCWVQRDWSSAYTPKGFFFCEVAAAWDMILNGPGGVPIESGCWRGKISFRRDENGVPVPEGKFAEQIKRWCEGCGACLPLEGRRDKEAIDDLSPSNLERLREAGSPAIKKGQFNLVTEIERIDDDEWKPMRYKKGLVDRKKRQRRDDDRDAL